MNHRTRSNMRCSGSLIAPTDPIVMPDERWEIEVINNWLVFGAIICGVGLLTLMGCWAAVVRPWNSRNGGDLLSCNCKHASQPRLDVDTGFVADGQSRCTASRHIKKSVQRLQVNDQIDVRYNRKSSPKFPVNQAIRHAPVILFRWLGWLRHLWHTLIIGSVKHHRVRHNMAPKPGPSVAGRCGIKRVAPVSYTLSTKKHIDKKAHNVVIFIWRSFNGINAKNECWRKTEEYVLKNRILLDGKRSRNS